MTLGEAERTQRNVSFIQSEPTVSVVIPAMNEARNFPRCLAACRGSTR